MSPYTLFIHRHRFAVWVATTAVKRGFASLDVMRVALEASELPDFVRDQVESQLSPAAFAQLHKRWCHQIMDALADNEVEKVTYGRAAKMVAMYLKTMVIVGPWSNTDLAFVAHPPIDRYLLQNLAKVATTPAEVRRLLKATNWTQLSEAKYTELVLVLQSTMRGKTPFWELERHWNVTDRSE